MNFRMFLIVTPVFLVFLPVSLSSAQSRSVEAIVKQSIRQSESKHIKKYVLTPGPFSFGDLLVVEDGAPHKKSAPCFTNAPSSPLSTFKFEESHVIWNRSARSAIAEALTGIGIKFSALNPGKPLMDGEITIKPAKDAATILAIVHFSGTREEISSQDLLDYTINTKWSQDCVSALRSQPYVIVDVLKGSVRIQFVQEIKGQREAIPFAVPSSWKPVVRDGKETGEFEQDVTLIIAKRILKIKSKGSAITWMRFRGFLENF